MDEMDRVQAVIEQHDAAALEAHRRQRAAHHAISRTVCADCGDAIPAERLAAAPGAERCIDCQQVFEREHA